MISGLVNLTLVFFFKQKTAYEMRISDWSSDVCSSDLPVHQGLAGAVGLCGNRIADEFHVVVAGNEHGAAVAQPGLQVRAAPHHGAFVMRRAFTGVQLAPHAGAEAVGAEDRKSTRLNSSH